MKKAIITFAYLTLFCGSITAQPKVSSYPDKTQIALPTDSHIVYTGRIERTCPDRPTFTYPGIEIKTAFTGNSIAMIAKPHSGYFMVKIDQSEPFKIAFINDSIAEIFNESGNTSHKYTEYSQKVTDTHQLTITYAGEGYHTRPEFRGFLLSKGTTLTAPDPLPTRKIEFIGNSITCGYGIEADEPSAPYEEKTANYYYSYAAQTARRLNAQAFVVARSGIGVYRNYNGPQTGDAVNMNTEYPYTLLYDDSHLWDFTSYIPDVVCINLGTNDTSTTGADPKLLTQGYTRLYRQVRNHYPQTKIILISGCMMKGNALAMAKQAMDKTQKTALMQGDSLVYRLDFPPHDGSLGYGASWHPSIRQHTQMADQLTKYIQQLMDWM